MDENSGLPELTLEIIERNDEPETWQAVPDFYGKTSADTVFVLDSESGTLTFGDGVHGRIPVAGAEIIAREYRYGGGQIGNAGAGTITALKSALPDVDSVTNVRAAAGGGDAETLDEVKLRAPHDLRTRERAVTAEDFVELTLQTPGVRIQRAYALAETSVDLDVEPPALESGQPGAVTVVILPENDEDTPQPTEDQLRLVCEHLNMHRLITTELYVVGPRYLDLSKLDVEVTVSRENDLKVVHEAIVQRLTDYFHPLRGGEDGRGWPFGHDIFFGSVYRQILSVDGVLRVLCLEIAPAEGDEECDDLITVLDGTLVHLPADVLNVMVKYDPYG
jgi:predicted phage baseplate assembly protein